MKIDFSDAPEDALERLLWLSGAKDVFDREAEAMWQRAYFEARQTGRLNAALSLGLHSRKKVLSFTRAENERRGRIVKRWPDF